MEVDLIKNAMAQIEEKKKAKEAQAQFSSKEFEELKESMIIMCSKPEGIIFARAFMRLCGLYKAVKNDSNLYEIGKERGKEELYLFFIVGLLPPDIRASIEKKIERKIEKKEDK